MGVRREADFGGGGQGEQRNRCGLFGATGKVEGDDFQQNVWPHDFVLGIFQKEQKNRFLYAALTIQ